MSPQSGHEAAGPPQPKHARRKQEVRCVREPALLRRRTRRGTLAWVSRRLGRSAAERRTGLGIPKTCSAKGDTKEFHVYIATAEEQVETRMSPRRRKIAPAWNRRAGDRRTFAVRLFFAEDPGKTAGATAEDSLAWGGFELWVKGKNLCFHLEQSEIYNAVHWYLLPLLEWLAGNWNYLLHEEKLPNRNAGSDAWESLDATFTPPLALSEQKACEWERNWHDWWSHHGLRSCRDGGIFPDVVFRRWQDQIEISWANTDVPGTPEHFQFLFQDGVALLAPSVIAAPLYDVLSNATSYLVERAPDSARIQKLARDVRLISETPADERLALMAGFGRGPEAMQLWSFVREQFQSRPDVLKAVFEFENIPLVANGTCQAALMFGSVSPTINKRDLVTLAKLLIDLFAPGSESRKLARLTRSAPLGESPSPSWRQGYDLANELLSSLGFEVSGHTPDLDTVFHSLSIKKRRVALDDKGTRAIAIAGTNHQPTVVINDSHETNTYPSGLRFSLAHELCHLLFDRTYGKQLALASGPWAPVDLEKRANAFAAMILMPEGSLRKVVASLSMDLHTADGVAEVAQCCGTSFSAALEHLTNLGFLSEADRDRLRERPG